MRASVLSQSAKTVIIFSPDIFSNLEHGYFIG